MSSAPPPSPYPYGWGPPQPLPCPPGPPPYPSNGSEPSPPPRRRRGSKIALGVLVGLFALLVIIGIVGANTGPSAAVGTVTPSSTTPAPRPRPAPTQEYAAQPAAAPTPVAGPARKITARDWKQIAKNPEAHAGERIVVYGQVTQFDAATGVDAFRANVDGVEHKPSYGWADYKTNTVLTGPATTLDELVDGDLFRAEVTVAGAYNYDTAIGGSTTVPQLIVEKVEVIGHV